MSLTSWGLMLGAVVLVSWWLQGRRRAGSVVHTRRTIPLGGQQALHVLELEGQRLLVGTGPGAAPRLLTHLGRAPAAGARPTTAWERADQGPSATAETRDRWRPS